MIDNLNKAHGLLALDLDGTSVADDYTMSQASRTALAVARRNGWITAFVTGRRDVDMINLEGAYELVDYFVLNNGGKITRCIDHEVLYNDKVPEYAAKQLIQYCLDNNLSLHITDGDSWLVNKMTPDTEEYAEYLGVRPGVYRALEELAFDGGIEAFTALEDWRPIAEYIENNLPEVVYTLSEPECIDVMVKGTNKWDTIKRLMEIEGIDVENVVAAGNYYNDLDMILGAGIGIAVANAPGEVKSQADYVTTRTNNEDAIVEIVDRFCK